MRHTSPSMTDAAIKKRAYRSSKAKTPEPVKDKRQHWFYDSTEEDQRAYLAKNPGSKFAKRLAAHQVKIEGPVTSRVSSLIENVEATKVQIEASVKHEPVRDDCYDPMTASFEEDLRLTKPGLHMLYTKWALVHLRYFDKMLTDLGNMANLNLMDMITAAQEERAKLVRTNAAYCEADQMLTSLELTVGTRITDY